MIQTLLNKLGIRTNNDKSNDPTIKNKLSLDPKYKFIHFFKDFFISSFVLLIIILLNSNVMFLITSAGTKREILDYLFPTDCQSYPYGPQYISKNDGHTKINTNGKPNIRLVCERMDDKQINKDDKHGPEWPYTNFNSDDEINPLQDFMNYILRCTATTDTTVNNIIKKTLLISSKTSNRFIIAILGLIILLLVGTFIIPATLYLFNLFINEVVLTFGDETFFTTKFLILSLLFFISFFFNPLYTIYKPINLFFRLSFYPLISGHAKDILKIIIENKDIIGFALGYSYILCAKKDLSDTMFNILHYLYLASLVGYILIQYTNINIIHI